MLFTSEVISGKIKNVSCDKRLTASETKVKFELSGTNYTFYGYGCSAFKEKLSEDGIYKVSVYEHEVVDLVSPTGKILVNANVTKKSKVMNGVVVIVMGMLILYSTFGNRVLTRLNKKK